MDGWMDGWMDDDINFKERSLVMPRFTNKET
jgi:hypothetical protein